VRSATLNELGDPIPFLPEEEDALRFKVGLHLDIDARPGCQDIKMLMVTSLEFQPYFFHFFFSPPASAFSTGS